MMFFSGEYAFLSNFYDHPIEYEGVKNLKLLSIPIKEKCSISSSIFRFEKKISYFKKSFNSAID